jgi:hypothetical protein
LRFLTKEILTSSLHFHGLGTAHDKDNISIWINFDKFLAGRVWRSHLKLGEERELERVRGKAGWGFLGF